MSNIDALHKTLAPIFDANLGDATQLTKRLSDAKNRASLYNTLKSLEEENQQFKGIPLDSPQAFDDFVMNDFKYPAIPIRDKATTVVQNQLAKTPSKNADPYSYGIDMLDKPIFAGSAGIVSQEHDTKAQNKAIQTQIQHAKKEAEEDYAKHAGPHQSSISRMISSGATAEDVLAPIQQVLGDNTKQKEAYSSLQTLKDAQELFKQAEYNKKNDSAIGNLGRGLGRTFQSRLWDQGKTDAQTAALTLKAVEKQKRGEQLSDTENSLLEAQALNSVSEDLNQNNLGRAYGVGEVTANSLPFMLDILSSPTMGAAKGVSGVVEGGIGAAIKQGLKSGAKGAIQAGAKYSSKALASDAIAATTTALTIQGNKSAADGYRRQVGSIIADVDNTGKVNFGGNYGGVDAGTALLKATASGAIENYSEMLGARFGVVTDVLKRVPAKALAGTAAGKFYTGVLDRASKSELKRFMEATQWQGTANEFLEEQAGAVLNHALVGDVDADSSLNWDTFISLSLMGGVFSAVNTVGYLTNKPSLLKTYKNAEKQAKNHFGEDWDSIAENLNTMSPQSLGSTLDVAKKQNSETAKVLAEYVGSKTALEGYEGARSKDKSPLAAINQTYDKAYEATPAEKYQIKREYDLATNYLTPEETPEQITPEYIQAAPVERQKGLQDFYKSKVAIDGLHQSYQDEFNDAVETAHKEIDDLSVNGRIHKISTPEGDYILLSEVDFDDEGTPVDPPKAIVVMDSNNNKFLMSTDAMKLKESFDSEAEKQAAFESIDDAIARKAEVEMSLGGVGFKETFLVDGTPTVLQIQAVRNDGTIDALLEDGQTQNIPLQSISYYYPETDSTVNSDATTQTNDTVPALEVGKEYAIPGNTFTIQSPEDANGKHIVHFENPVNGRNVHSLTPDEIGGYLAQVQPETSVSPELEVSGTASTQPVEQEVDYESLPAEQTALLLQEESGEGALEAVEIIMNNYKSQLKKVQKERPTSDMTSSKDVIAFVNDKTARRKALEAKIEYWKDVYGVLKNIQTKEETPAALAGIEEKIPKKLSISDQVRAMGDYLDIEDYILRDIAQGGAKFRWKGEAHQHGLAQELGFTKSNKERLKRISLLKNADGYTPETYSEHLTEIQSEYGLNPDMDQNDIRGLVIDILRDVYSPARALERLQQMHNEVKERYEKDEAKWIEREAERVQHRNDNADEELKQNTEDYGTESRTDQVAHADGAHDSGTSGETGKGTSTQLDNLQKSEEQRGGQTTGIGDNDGDRGHGATPNQGNIDGESESISDVHQEVEDDGIVFRPNLEFNSKIGRISAKSYLQGDLFQPDGEMSITNSERVLTEKGDFSFDGSEKITSSHDVAFLLRNLEHEASENVFIVLIDQNDKAHVVYLSTGNSTSSIVDISLVAAAIKEFSAKKIHFVHNHPSGMLRPSHQDISVHKNISALLENTNCALGSSIIINLDSGKFVEYDPYDSSILEHHSPKDSIHYPVKSFGRQKLYNKITSSKSITSSKDVAEYLSKIKRGTLEKNLILICNNSNIVTRAYVTDELNLFDIVANVGKHGNTLFIASNKTIHKNTLGSLVEDLRRYGIKLFDYLEVLSDKNILENYKSYADSGVMDTSASYSKSGIDQAALRHKADEFAKDLGVSINWVDRAHMQAKGGEFNKAYFNIATGEVYICLQNNTSLEDVYKSILHEAVAHKGLRSMFGGEFDKALDTIYDEATQEIKDKIDSLPYANRRVATEEYLAVLAENINPENQGLWDKVKSLLSDLIRSIGIQIKLSDNDLRFMLYASAKALKNNPVGVAKTVTFGQRMRVNFSDESKATKLREAEQSTEKNPTESQKKAGNYKMGHVSLFGFDISIENPIGSVRSGVSEDGKEWKTKMENTYGYIKGTKSVDGDHIDIFIGKNLDSSKVFVIDQIDPKTGAFDEHKIMLGFNSIQEARDAYLSNYEKNWGGLGSITETNLDRFQKWTNSSDRKTKPFAEYAAFIRNDEEMHRIKAEAVSNGTFMLAPNKKSTNLTERQWLQVRTANFKNWFGDWEKAAQIQKLRTSEPIMISKDDHIGKYELNRNSIKGYLKDNLRGQYINKDTGDHIEIRKDGTQKVTSHSMGNNAHLLSFVAIPEMIEKSIFIVEISNDKNNGKYDSYRYYVCGLKIDGQDYTVKITVGVKGINKYYDHALTEIEKSTLIDNIDALSTTFDINKNTLFEHKDTKLISILQTNSSKVVDENGEPLVLYHFSDWSPLKEKNGSGKFDVSKARQNADIPSFFFTPNLEDWKDMGKHRTDVFLNIKKPLSNPSVSMKMNGKDFRAEIIKKGYDGTISVEDGVIEEYSAFEPNQIKSATENDGSFDSRNDDIRFRSYNDFEKTKKSLSGSKIVARFVESYVDNASSLKNLQDEAEKLSKLPIESYENAYLSDTAVASKTQREVEYFEKMVYYPALEDFKRIILSRYTDVTPEEAYQLAKEYAIAKHGLERNEYEAAQIAKERVEPLRAKIREQFSKQEIDQKKYEKEMKRIDILEDDYFFDYAKNDYSGLTNLVKSYAEKYDLPEDSFKEIAEKMVFEFEKTIPLGDTIKFWDKIHEMTAYSLEKTYKSGRISKEMYKKIKEQFKYYIPLRGWIDPKAEDIYEYLDSPRQNAGGALKTIKGRTSVAEDPFATILEMTQNEIIYSNKNLQKQKFFNMVNNRLSTGLFSVSKTWYVKQVEGEREEWVVTTPDIGIEDGPDEIRQKIEEFTARMKELQNKGLATQLRSDLKIKYKITDEQKKEHEVRVKVNGDEYVIYVNKNPRAAQYINGYLDSGKTEFNKFWNSKSALNKLDNLSRYMKGAYTTLNPEFVLTNAARDFFFANLATWVKEDATYTKKFQANFIRSIGELLPLVIKHNNGKLFEAKKAGTITPLESMFLEFVMNGGETGYTAVKKLEEFKADVLKKIGKQKHVQIHPSKFLEIIEIANRAIENVSRFATYRTSREMGRDIDTSVSNAKNITVNFNRGGSGMFGSDMVNKFYFFFNAGVQGLSNYYSLFQKSPIKATAATTGMLAMGLGIGFLNQLLIQMLAGDGDEYDNLNPWVKKNNISLYAGNNLFVSIPLPHELRGVYALGTIAYDCMNDNIKDRSITQEMFDAMIQAVPFNPINGVATSDGADRFKVFASNFIPDVAKPISEAYMTNKDFMGLPVYKDTPFNKSAPEWTKAYASTNKGLVDLTESMNEITGGDKVVPGAVDVNPARVEHLTEGYLGGLFQFFNRIVKTGIDLSEGDVKVKNLPFANKFIKQSYDKNESQFVNQKYYDFMDDYKSTEKIYQGYLKETKMGTLEYAKKLSDFTKSDEFRRYSIAKRYKSAIDRIQKIQNSTNNKLLQDSLEPQILQIKMQLLDAVN